MASVVDNGQLKFPNEWFDQYTVLNNKKYLVLIDEKDDMVKWKSKHGNLVKFSTNRMWKYMMSSETEVNWYKVVWFSNFIPRHAFILWLLIHERLPTQDIIIKWNPDKNMKCSLCGKVTDSHDHLFFKCNYSSKVWHKARVVSRIQCLVEEWKPILEELIAMPNRRNIWIVVKKVVFAACVYFLWQERNLRQFQDSKREWDVLWKLIEETVKLKLSSLKVVKSNDVKEVFSV